MIIKYYRCQICNELTRLILKESDFKNGVYRAITYCDYCGLKITVEVKR